MISSVLSVLKGQSRTLHRSRAEGLGIPYRGYWKSVKPRRSFTSLLVAGLPFPSPVRSWHSLRTTSSSSPPPWPSPSLPRAPASVTWTWRSRRPPGWIAWPLWFAAAWNMSNLDIRQQKGLSTTQCLSLTLSLIFALISSSSRSCFLTTYRISSMALTCPTWWWGADSLQRGKGKERVEQRYHQILW